MTGVTVNLGADFDDPGGVGRHARSFAAALSKHARVLPFYFSAPASPTYADARMPRLAKWDENAPALCLASLGKLRHVPGRPSIDYTVWETSRLPARVVDYLKTADQVWVPTEWGSDILADAGYDPDRLKVVPEGVDGSLFFPPVERPERDVFRFLSVGKWEARKGTEDLVRTFSRAFRADEPVELVLHAGNPYHPEFDVGISVATFQRTQTKPGGRITVSDPLPLDAYIQLIQNCDAFVLPTRAEGWGLPILEAMACGLPCIVTDYGGHRIFATANNCYLIRVAAFCPARDPVNYPEGEDWGLWAQPDLDHLAHLLRHVFENRREAAVKGDLARREAVTLWSWDNAARIALDHLRAL